MTCKSGHSIFNRNCKSCKLIQKKWYLRAKKTGFEDIENEYGEIIDHKTLSDLIQRKHFKTTSVFEANIQYYNWAEQMIEKGKFKSTKDKLIWKYHIKGLSHEKISPKVKFERSWISRKIKKISRYLKDQGN